MQPIKGTVVSVTVSKIVIRFRGGNTETLTGNFSEYFKAGQPIWAAYFKHKNNITWLSSSPKFTTTPPHFDWPEHDPACDGWCGFLHSGVKWEWSDEDIPQP
jgi:hypothetical protein